MEVGQVAACPLRHLTGRACPAVVCRRADADRDCYGPVLLALECVPHRERVRNLPVGDDPTQLTPIPYP